jgi:hypothetical protein
MSKIQYNVNSRTNNPTIYTFINHKARKKVVKINTNEGEKNLKGVVFYNEEVEHFVNAQQLMSRLSSIVIEGGIKEDIFYKNELDIDRSVTLYIPLKYLGLPITRQTTSSDDMGGCRFFRHTTHRTEYFILYVEINSVDFYEEDWKDYLKRRIDELDFKHIDFFFKNKHYIDKIKEIFNDMSKEKISREHKTNFKGSGVRKKNETKKT